MKLSTAIVAHSLPFAPDYLCGGADHALCLSDVRFLPAGNLSFPEDILYFTEWKTLVSRQGSLPAYLMCVGGGEEAAAFFTRNSITGIVSAGSEDPIGIFSIIQSIFLRFNQTESQLLAALQSKAPTREILNLCAEFFQNHLILFDSERNLIDYSTNYMPGPDDSTWTETLKTGRRPEKVLAEARKHAYYMGAVRTPTSDFMDLGAGLTKIMTYSFYEGGRRLTTLTVTGTSKPLSPCQLKLLDYVGSLISPALFHAYSSSLGLLESLRSVLVSLLEKETVDPLVAARSVAAAGWGMEDNYLLIMISFPESSRSSETLTRRRHIYERLFPECIAIQYGEGLVVLVHNDTCDVMHASLPDLEKQLAEHGAVCGLSFPFKGLLQIGPQYSNAETAIRHGDVNKRIRLLSEAITAPVVSRIASAIPLYPLCHREAIRIFEYDIANGTELLLTLETYLMQCKSLKAAADRLYIHRNTMTYRLSCIGKITNLSLDDPQERLHLLLSCIVLRTLGKQGP